MAETQRRSIPEEEGGTNPGETKMGFLEHLDELRTRLIRSCVAVAAGMTIALLFVDRIADFVLDPTLRMLAPGTSLIMTRPGEGLSFYLDVALKYAVLVIFIVAAVLTPSSDPWNQALFATPMVGLYVISIGVAWLVAPRRTPPAADAIASRDLKLVFAAAVVNQVRRRNPMPAQFPRLWQGGPER